MKQFEIGIALMACVLVVAAAGLHAAHGQGILAAGDEIIAIDFDFAMQSDYPLAEGPVQRELDGDSATKYLNFGKETSGLILTPISGASTVRSMVFTTADDEIPRDPASWVLHGTNAPIVSGDNSFGTAENWTLIGSGDVALPNARMTDGPVVSFSNDTSYDSYRLLFPTLKDTVGANSMQVADIAMFESTDASGPTIVDFFDDSLGVDPGSLSAFPSSESPPAALDGDVNTKYLNFGRDNSGFIVSPSFGSAAVKAFQITTADDAANRDPAAWELYGTNSPVLSFNNSTGDDESWTLVDSGPLDLPLDRLTAGDPVLVDNNTEYTSYRMVFPTVRFPEGTDAMQFAEIQFFNVTGDFNDDGSWNCVDVDALVAEIVAGTNTASFDVTTDGVVNELDLVAWLVVGGGANPADTGGNPFLAGDANLDGTVDGSDFLTWNTNKFTNVAAWCSGDFNADGTVDGTDFLAWNTNKFMSSDSVQSVPEPHSGLALLALLLTGWLRGRK